MRRGRHGVPKSGFGCPIARVFCERWGFLAVSNEKIPTSRKPREKWGTRVSGEAVL
jgi:hypothetical protein